MGLAQKIAHEQERALLVSAPAAGLLHGVVSAVEQDYRWVRPRRFSDAQMRALGSCQAWHPGLYRQMARSTAGMCVEFETDASEVALEVRVDGEPKGTRAVLDDVARHTGQQGAVLDGISADVDGRHLACRMPDVGQQVLVFSLCGNDPEDALGLQPLPGMARTRHVRIWLPALRGCVVRDVLCDGSFVRPVAHRQHLLVLGDSIVQGFVSGDPAYAWPSLLAQRLGLDVINQGVAGQVFQPGSLFGLADSVNPARIMVAFGANYRFEPCVARRLAPDVRAYLLEVARLWPEVPTQVLTPLWHDEAASPSHGMSCWEQMPALITAQVAKHPHMSVVDGLELVEHDPAFFADGCEHPNERGCRQIATRLNAVIRVPSLRPSLVGRRRKKQPALLEREAQDSDTLPLPLTGL